MRKTYERYNNKGSGFTRTGKEEGGVARVNLRTDGVSALGRPQGLH